MFFKKSKKPYIKFIPLFDWIKEFVPILPAREILPEWWEKIKINDNVTFLDKIPAATGTIRRCPGVMDLLRHGYVIQAWSDIKIEVNGHHSFNYQFADKRHFGKIHDSSQFLDHVPEHIRKKYFWVFKLQSPWFIQTSPGYSILHADPFYHFNEYFDIGGGIQDSDIYHDANQFLFIKKEGQFIIERGTPLSVIYPFKRENYDFTIEDYNEQRAKKLMAKEEFLAFSKFSSMLSYKKEQYRNKKCPFSKES